jgi:hypothetical protein
MKALIAGWFSFPNCTPTAGDFMARDLIGSWLNSAGVSYDFLLAAPFEGGVRQEDIRPADYTHFLLVCGPYVEGLQTDLMRRLPHCVKVGINLSFLSLVKPGLISFDHLFERDSERTIRPDLTFICPVQRVPVVGRILVHPQPEYGSRAWHDQANAAIESLLRSRCVATVAIDTQLGSNAGGLSTAAEVVSVIGKMDMVITTRLHGTVLALKSGVPALAVDPIAGGAKIMAAAEAIGWPVIFTVDRLDADALVRGFEYCLTPEAVQLAKVCSDRAGRALESLHDEFIASILSTG